ncbi:DsbA family protein [Mycolicibacterium thermoresistibile]|uniref:Thioredoxin-like fold domain-containing protein n=2 Tax=Mycolicibacterium thermoresistibile TaxID=1797 RepID=G7CMR6_MYCT3|nr:thioredoxin domain-containing protein [Mycolicibacterium thermoresistibile]EHI10769.1 hypothetical protein KEK_21565 [Mycolicibacterium thermoresistibile ATCC 19527]MCV7189329.1 DsbA family protein [Mycolicibacterium thermoresistibile]GAT16544.1 protein-disulfide isomerase [Mycolicibacterium thermoresistibile]SNW17767.1 protein-disulfide isomerase [Mycolicibacterium thermoresistibile]
MATKKKNARKPNKNARYDLKAADRRRNLFIQIGLTAVVVVFAVALVLYIVMTSDRPGSGDGQAVRVTSENVITDEESGEPKVVLSLYEDPLCPGCAGFERVFGPTISRIIDSGAAVVDYHMVAILDSTQSDNYSSRAGAAAYCVADESVDAFRRFHSALFVMQPREVGGVYPDNRQLIETARQAGAVGEVPNCINNGRYVDMVKGMAAAGGIHSTPTVRINGEDFDFTKSTPDDLVAAVKEIVGDVPGLEAAPPAQPQLDGPVPAP